MKGRPVEWLPEELAWIQANAGQPRAELHSAFCWRFGRRDVSLNAIKSLCSRRGWKSATDTRFRKGQTPQNKGKTMPFHPNSAATRFKPGSTPPNRRPFGSERIDIYGYVQIKVDIPNPHTGHRGHYVHKHRWLWEQANGPLPEGMALKCLDGNRRNCAPDNWQPIPRALLPRLAGRWSLPYDQAEPELKPALLAISQLDHAARTARKKARP